ncbi:MAG: NUDIX domain-containing protein [Candidatus Nomurabacteria bacterium]|nr:NUDIX domain-containing protein [Candidatus Nomurabacteria bacterium]
MSQNITIRCLALILHEDKLLVAKHAEEKDYYALPGGKLEKGENPLECIKREIKEELGVEVSELKLAYVNKFETKEGKENLEFFFLVKDGQDFVDLTGNDRTHAFEIFEMRWIGADEEVRLLPESIHKEFKENGFNLQEVKFIS